MAAKIWILCALLLFGIFLLAWMWVDGRLLTSIQENISIWRTDDASHYMTQDAKATDHAHETEISYIMETYRALEIIPTQTHQAKVRLTNSWGTRQARKPTQTVLAKRRSTTQAAVSTQRAVRRKSANRHGTATRKAFEDKLISLCARADTTCNVNNGLLDVVAPDYVKKAICDIARCK